MEDTLTMDAQSDGFVKVQVMNFDDFHKTTAKVIGIAILTTIATEGTKKVIRKLEARAERKKAEKEKAQKPE